jgi:hypothetical protein
MQNPGKFFTEFYPQISNLRSDSLSTEIMVLQKPVILPYINEEHSCSQLMRAYEEAECEYRTADEWYSDVLANFYPLMLAPMVKDGDSTMLIHNAPDVSHILSIGGEFETTEYTEQNYLELIIPKNIVMSFRKEIPKGTKFTCNFIGGSTMYRSMKITNVVEIGEELYMEPYKCLTWEECVSEAGGEENVPFWIQERVEIRVEEYNNAVEEVSHILQDKVEQQKEVRGTKNEVMYT